MERNEEEEEEEEKERDDDEGVKFTQSVKSFRLIFLAVPFVVA